jgi:hypothetical protein
MKREYNISLACGRSTRLSARTEGKLPMLDIPKLARDRYDIGGIELVNHMLASTRSPTSTSWPRTRPTTKSRSCSS